MEELRLRLQRRNSDDKIEIERRLAEAQKEISKSNKYDYVIIINDDLDKSVEEIKSILNKERIKKLEEKQSPKDL